MTANTSVAKVIPVDKFLPPERDDHITDLEYARKNLYSTIEQAEKTIQGISDVAECSQHPRAYEVLNQSLKLMGDLNKDLVDISKTKKDAKETGPEERNGHVTQNLFVGSTKDLAQMLKAKK